ncbi:histidinol-phosphate aminotransferase [Opitutaceae bacterium TAV5]|nr:histidinol-phosphate aminotransferase [Opitutaceae bacterium TAV5]
MLLTDLVNPAILKQPVYEPGKPIEDVARELGLDPASIIKLASNENALGPSPRGVAAATAALGHAELYPDGGCVTLRAKLAARYELDPSQFVIGNGSNELLELLGHVFLRPGDEVVMGNPAFIIYKLVALLFGAKPVEVPLVDHTHDLPALAAAVTPLTKLVFVASPNNPTGTANPAADLLAFARALPPHVVLVLDEAYAEFLEGDYRADIRPLIAEGRHVIGLRTFSKIYGLASLRVGYGYCSPELAGLLNRARQPFNVNAIGLAAAEAALDDHEFVARSLATNRAGLAQLEAGLRALGFGFDIKTVPSHANFILAKTGHGARVFAELQRRGVIIRPVAGYGLPDWIRITVGTESQNDRLLRELATVLRLP